MRVVGSDGTTHIVTLAQMKTMNVITKNGSFQNSYGNIRGAGEYSGVKIADLIQISGGMTSSQLAIVNATDGYNQTFSYRNVYPNTTAYAIQGDMVLAFEYNGTLVPDWTDGFRIMFLPDDGYFNNTDGAATIESEFYSGAAGPKCVSNVDTIRVFNRAPTVLTVKVGGVVTSYSMNQLLKLPSVTGVGGYKKSGTPNGTLMGPFSCTGISVLDLLNRTGPLPANYSVRMISSDNYETIFNRTQVEGFFEGYNKTTGVSVGRVNCTLMLAYVANGSLLDGNGPLRAVMLNEDYFTDSHFWAKFVVNITLIDEVKPWSLDLRGVQSWNMTHDTYYSLASCAHHRRTIAVGEDAFWGVALWTIVASMDGGNDTHYTFDVSLATHGYQVVLYDGAGHNATFTAAQMAGNYSIVVAGWVNGELLLSPDYPLVLVTPGHLLLGNIVRIDMIGWNT